MNKYKKIEKTITLHAQRSKKYFILLIFDNSDNLIQLSVYETPLIRVIANFP